MGSDPGALLLVLLVSALLVGVAVLALLAASAGVSVLCLIAEVLFAAVVAAMCRSKWKKQM